MNNYFISLILGFVLLLNACSKPSISTRSGNAPTGDIFIQVFYDQSGDGPPTIGQTMTEKVKDYFQRNARSLNIVNDDIGGFKLEGAISRYKVTYSSPTVRDGVETTDLSRLTIEVTASYTDYEAENSGVSKEDNPSFKDKKFSFFKDFDSSQSLSDVEEELVSEILDQIVIDIFTAAFDKW